MPFAENSGVSLYYEDTGQGETILFLHEFAGDHRSWEGQVRYFSRTHRCIVMSSRGYPPSDVPETETDYSQDIAIADVIALLDHLDIKTAIIVGLSMGAYTALRIALSYPDRVCAVVAASGGAGSYPEHLETFRADAHGMADNMIATDSVPADGFANGPTRIQLKLKDLREWQEFRDHLDEHSPLGSAMTLRKVQAGRPSLFDFKAEFNQLNCPVLLMVGDEDDPCLDVNLFLKRNIPRAGLAVVPKSGHLLNLEDPANFNRMLANFLTMREHVAWPARAISDTPFAGVGVRQETE